MSKNSTENVEKNLLNQECYESFLKENGDALTNVHPGSYILEQLQLRNIKKKDVAKAVDLNLG